MKIRWRKRKPATYATPKEKRVTLTPEEVAILLSLVAVMSDKFAYIDDEADMQAVIDKALLARKWVHNGHKVNLVLLLQEHV